MGTWSSPNGRTMSLTDQNNYRSIAKKRKVYRGADMGFAHFLVKLKIMQSRACVTRKQNQSQKAYDVDILSQTKSRHKRQCLEFTKCMMTRKEH